MKTVLFSIVVLLLVATAAEGRVRKEYRKKLAGSPSEFGLHDIPSPVSQIQKEDSAFYEASLSLDSSRGLGHLVTSMNLLVDSDISFVFSVMTKYQDKLKVSLEKPDGTPFDPAPFATPDYFPIGDQRIPAVVYQIKNPERGYWNLTLSTSNALPHSLARQISEESEPNVGIILWNNNGVEIYTHLSTYFTHTDSVIGLVATTTPENQKEVEELGAAPIRRQILSAIMGVTLPDGQTLVVPMRDDGHELDLVAGDGIFVGKLVASKEVGNYRAKAILTGVHSSGKEFVRTTQHVINVVQRSLELTGEATAILDVNEKHRMRIHLNVNLTENAEKKPFRAYAEVWGKDAEGKDVPICWVGGVSEVESYNGKNVISLSLDLNWVSLAKALPPFTLKKVYVSDLNTQIPESKSAQIPVTLTKKYHVHYEKLSLSAIEITREMREGKPPAKLLSKRGTGKKGLVLLHGYCSAENPWNATKDVWTNPHFFLNPSASITNEEFAQKVIEYASSEGLDSYAMIGHSQGGMVATHILNYYFTGLDNLDTTKRIIQSVGTPYLGSNAAGTAANIGKQFGVACGSNFDLTTDGAVLWLSGITATTRDQVYYYTTTYGDGGFFGDYCSLPMNAVLEWPNDGTTELNNAKLEGGHNMGNKKEWCHVSDMKYPAQTTDRTRNKEMNEKAASN